MLRYIIGLFRSAPAPRKVATAPRTWKPDFPPDFRA